jgi:Chitinase class I
VPDYIVLERIRNAMAEEGDEPASDEADEIHGQARFAYGKSGIRYVWLAETGRVYRFDPAPEGLSVWTVFTADEIAACTGCNAAIHSIHANWPLIFDALRAQGQGSVRSLIGAIGTVAIETASKWLPCRELYNDPPGQFAYFEEMYGVGNHPSAEAMEHTLHGDGARYFGRGFIQLTWKNNYRAMGQRLGIDLVGNPDLALDAQTAADVFAIYWRDRDIQAQADREDWAAVRRSVQGGSAGLGRVETSAAALLKIARARGLLS